ncbi:MAG: hypothetical protein Q4Q06_03595 [Bacteroidota bacterium]|nr:hypothetical protein [Bacteroidota bacterium]
MIVSIFKRNYFLQFAILIIVTLLLWLPAFITPVPIMNKGSFDMPFFDFMASVFPQQNVVNTITCFLLVLLQGLLINHIFTFYQLSQKTSFFPAFVYVLLMSSDYRFMTLNSVTFANTFIVLALFSFLRCYNKNEGLDEIYLSSVLIAIGTLFYSPVILLILWLWIGLFNFKIYKLRSFFVSIFGLLTPFLVLFVYYYLSDNNQAILNFVSSHFAIVPSFDFLNQPIQIVYIAYMFLLLIPAYFISLMNKNDQKLSVRKRISTILLLFIFTLLPFVYDLNSPTMSLILAVPSAYILSTFFFSIKRNIYSDLYIVVLLILTVVKILINT